MGKLRKPAIKSPNSNESNEDDSMVEICRLCLMPNEIMEPIFPSNNDETMAKRIFECTTVKVIKTLDSGIPLSICDPCKSVLEKYHQFREVCIKNDGILNNLRKLMKPQKEIREECPVPKKKERKSSIKRGVVPEKLEIKKKSNSSEDLSLEVIPPALTRETTAFQKDKHLVVVLEPIDVDRYFKDGVVATKPKKSPKSSKDPVNAPKNPTINDVDCSPHEEIIPILETCEENTSQDIEEARLSPTQTPIDLVEVEMRERPYDMLRQLLDAPSLPMQDNTPTQLCPNSRTPSLEYQTESEKEDVSQQHPSKTEFTKYGKAGQKCDECGKVYMNLYQHRVSKHRIKRFSCDYCGARFATLASQRRHLEAHEKRRLNVKGLLFHCELCGLEFLRNSTFYEHLTSAEHLSRLGVVEPGPSTNNPQFIDGIVSKTEDPGDQSPWRPADSYVNYFPPQDEYISNSIPEQDFNSLMFSVPPFFH